MNFLRKSILAILILVLLTGVGFAATNTFDGSTDNNWNVADNWSLGHVPIAGEDVALAAFAVVINTTAIPADYATGGRLATITMTSGTLNLALDVVGSTSIGFTTLTAGTAGTGGSFIVTGATANVLTISGNIHGTLATTVGKALYLNTTGTCNLTGTIDGGHAGSAYGAYMASAGAFNVTGAVTGGTAANTYGIFNASTGVLTINGAVSGGSNTDSVGIHNNSTGALNVTGNVSGGAGLKSYGIQASAVATVTLNSCHLINGAGAVAYAGYPPAWVNTGAYYLQWNAGVAGATTTKFGKEPAAAELKSGVVCGDVTGTYQGAPFGMTP
jgi:hypothetical protein